MDFGDLVFFLIFIIIIITNIIGQVKKSRRSPSASGEAEEGRFESKTRPESGETSSPAKTGWRQVLDEILVEVREQAPARRRTAQKDEGAASRQPSGWDLLMENIEKEEAPAPVPRPKRENVRKPAAKAGKDTPAPVYGTKRTSLYTPVSRERPERISYTPAYWSEEQRKTGAKSHYRGPAVRRMPIRDLRNAMIWHEILSPPVALRDMDTENFR